LFGIDTREVGDFTGKSDSMMILSVNKTQNKIHLVSVMRDSLVPYEHKGKKGYTKITELYAFGGPELCVKTLNQIYGLDISEYATVNFFGMKDIIEAVGGIDAEITPDEIDPKSYRNINSIIQEVCESLQIDPTPHYIHTTGKMHLNGIQGVSYARVRFGKNIWGSNNDFGRTERQRYVMQELFKKALAMDVKSYPKLIKELAPHVKTSLSNNEMISLAGYLVDKPTMEVSRVPSDEYIINADFRGTGASTVYYNYKYAGKVLRAFFYEGITPEDYMAQNGVDKTSWFPGGNGNSGNNSSSGNSSEDSSSSQDSSSSEDSNSSGDSSSGDSSNDSSNSGGGSESGNSGGSESGNSGGSEGGDGGGINSGTGNGNGNENNGNGNTGDGNSDGNNGNSEGNGNNDGNTSPPDDKPVEKPENNGNEQKPENEQGANTQQ
jgi:LCP family protein required for cell wall assembly